MQINYPPPQFTTRVVKEQQYLFCPLRKRWLLLTPEEWVRQNFVAYLMQVLQYPQAMIAAEKGLVVNGLKKRFDLLVYDAGHKPWLLVECKEEGVPLTEAVLQQALRYNLAAPVPFIVITNGKETMGWKRTADGLSMLHALPAWGERI